jgi:hypothetical protein
MGAQQRLENTDATITLMVSGLLSLHESAISSYLIQRSLGIKFEYDLNTDKELVAQTTQTPPLGL